MVIFQVVGHAKSWDIGAPYWGSRRCPRRLRSRRVWRSIQQNKRLRFIGLCHYTYHGAGGQFESENISGCVARRFTKISGIVVGDKPGLWCHCSEGHVTILLPVWRFWLHGVIQTVGNGTAVMSPVVGPGHSGGKWGPVLGVTALPASTPITPSVEEYPTE